MDDDALMVLRANALFTYDERGRMTWTNEPDRRPAPRVFLGCTATGCVARFGASLADAPARRLTDVIARWPLAGEATISEGLRAAIHESLAAEAPVAHESGGPVYRFPVSIALPGDAIEITPETIALVRETFPWLYDDLAVWRPCFAVVVDGAARSVCFTSRIGVAAMEAGVFTLPDYRGLHLAVTTTAAWGASIQERNFVPLYSTDWTNHASQAVARRAGLIMFGADATWR